MYVVYIGTQCYTLYNKVDACPGSHKQTIIASKTLKYKKKTINNLVVIISLRLLQVCKNY